ncbi:MAG TPA: hypothetical protein VGL18_14300 [Actinomycetota bacterium]
MNITQAFEAPGVIDVARRSTLFWFVSAPSGQRAIPPVAVEPSSTSPAPEPSVYGAPVSPS